MGDSKIKLLKFGKLVFTKSINKTSLPLIDYVPACGEVQVASVDQGIAPKTNSEKTKVKIHKQKNNIYPYFYY